MKITVAIPTNRGINPQTVGCVLEMILHSREHKIEPLVASEGYTVAENRNYIAVQAVNNGSDYLLMIDDDMTFEPTILEDLLANEKDICGAAYHPRCDTGQVIKYIDKEHPIRLDDPEIKNDPKYQTTFECYATGTGIILIKCDVFKKISQPFFEMSFHPNGCNKEGEDWYFCKKAKQYGIKTFADPRPKVGHIGEVIY